MNRYTMRMLLRSIRGSLGRYLAILAIVALGVGFFAGLKSSYPAMRGTAERYLDEQRLYDFQLLSTLGFTGEDVEAFAALEGVAAAEGGYFTDAFLRFAGEENVYRLMSLPERVSLPVLTAGRLPEAAGECLADSHAFREEDIGQTVTLTPANDEDTLELLPDGVYTIVGLARSPRYLSSVRGDSSLGSGKIHGFLYLTDEAFDSEAFHELCLWCDIDAPLYSETYTDARDRLEPSVKTLLNRRGQLRYGQLRAEAQAELDDAQAEIDQGWLDYEDGRRESREELDEALEKLNRTEGQLLAAQKELDAQAAELEAGMAKIPAARAEIRARRAELDAGAAQLADGRAQLTAARAELEAQAQTVADGQAQLAAAKAAVTEPIQQQIAQLQAQIQGIQAAMAEISGENEGDEQQLAALSDNLAAAQAGLAAAREGLAAAEGQFAGQEAELAGAAQAIREGLAQLGGQEAELKTKEAAIADGRRQLDAAEAELKAAEDSYPANRSKIFDAQWKINDGWWQLEKGREEYEDGRREAEEKLRDAEQELRDAEQELADAKAQAEEDLQLEVYTLNRDTNQGHLTFGNDIRIIDGLANAFPVFFALVAALVCVTTMTRMVGEERTLIGTMKALGYSGGAVMSKYLLYSGSAALLGCAAGFFLGTTAIPYVVWTAYNMLYDYAKLDFYFGPRMYGLCLAASVLGTLLVTWLACRQELREKPAELIRPKAPKAGRRILLEYLGPLWRRLPFLSKVSLRNAFRHPLRVLMLLLGIGGCTALMVAGFGVKDSVGRISDYQYGEIFLYDLSVSLDTDDFADDAQAASLWAGDAERWAMTRQEPVTILTDREEKSSRLIAAADGALEGMISLHDRQGELPFPGPGQAVVTEKIAESLELRVGDSLTLETDGGERLTVQISGICQNYLNHYVFLNSASLKETRHNTALLRAAEGVDVDRLGARLRAAEGVDYVSLSNRERETMERSMASLDLLVLVLILCSGALAFITQYNLTNINIMERVREIATVKVLGFYPGETASYVLRENRLLAVLGAALGLVLGKLLHRVVIQAVVVDYMSFEIRIAPLSYALAFAITIVFALLTNLAMYPRLEKVNMAESLKSVE